MKADITKNTFNVSKHFSQVIMQQGRVQLDADWNEQSSILLHYLRTFTKDFFGEYVPIGNAFIIDRSNQNDLKITNGHLYVDGILCENEGELNSVGDHVAYTYKNQPHYKPNTPFPDQGVAYLVYLDVWEHLITHVEDESIREVALLGADTATRMQIVWQVKVELGSSSLVLSEKDIKKNWSEWKKFWQPEHRGLLKAKAKQADAQIEPCNISPHSRYRAKENQLYRVEIHKGGKLSEKPSFKWSCDNGSVVSKATLIKDSELSLDNTQGYSSGKFVELMNDEQELRGESGLLLKINKIDEDVLYLDGDVVRPTLPTGEKWPTKARLWDSAAILITEESGEDKWLMLEEGVQIQFQPANLKNEYRSGDYWLIPARVASGDIEWPTKDGNPMTQEPHGIKHHYAPLALVKTDHSVVDLRILMP